MGSVGSLRRDLSFEAGVGSIQPKTFGSSIARLQSLNFSSVDTQTWQATFFRVWKA